MKKVGVLLHEDDATFDTNSYAIAGIMKDWQAMGTQAGFPQLLQKLNHNPAAHAAALAIRRDAHLFEEKEMMPFVPLNKSERETHHFVSFRCNNAGEMWGAKNASRGNSRASAESVQSDNALPTPGAKVAPVTDS